MKKRVAFALGFLLAFALTGHAEKPRRVVSLCLHGDQLLLQLAERQHIAALSWLAADPELSPQWQKASGLPTTRGAAEELLILQPDLVLAGRYTARVTVAALQRLGVRVLELDIAANFDDLRGQIREVSAALEEPERGQAVLQTLEARLARLAAENPPPGERPEALFWFQTGFTPGPRTFANALLEIAGFRNLASRFGSGGEMPVSREAVLLSRPRYLFLVNYCKEHPLFTQLSEKDPIFRHLPPQTRRVSIPFLHLACADPSNLDLAEFLQQQREAGEQPSGSRVRLFGAR